MRYVLSFEFLLFAAAMAGFALVGAHITGNQDWLTSAMDFLRNK
jgi:hypothetical protein